MTRLYFAEGLGTAFLLIAVVGSGIMADALTQDVAVALLCNAIATGCALYVLITVLGPVSGAHFNPAVTMVFVLQRELPIAHGIGYVAAQVSGGILGVWLTHLMFDLSVFQWGGTTRTGSAQWLSEIVATFGLLFVIAGGLRHRPDAVPALVAAYITGAYFFTASTSFANPAVTIARSLTDSFAGILPGHAPAFIAAQIVGAVLAAIVLPRLFSQTD